MRRAFLPRRRDGGKLINQRIISKRDIKLRYEGRNFGASRKALAGAAMLGATPVGQVKLARAVVAGAWPSVTNQSKSHRRVSFNNRHQAAARLTRLVGGGKVTVRAEIVCTRRSIGVGVARLCARWPARYSAARGFTKSSGGGRHHVESTARGQQNAHRT